jgi:hypothetical protein
MKLRSNQREDICGILGSYNRIPIMFIASGDQDAARELFGFGRKLLRDLSVKLGPNSIQNGSSRYERDDGSRITVSINYGVPVITIHVPIAGEDREVVKLFDNGFKCFVFAMIEQVACYDPLQDPPDPNCDLDTMTQDGERFYYDVSFFSKGDFIYLENYQIYSAGWERYEVGQYVLLGPDAVYQPTCCIDETYLSDAVLDELTIKLRYGYLDVYPVHILGNMIVC